MAQDPAPSAKAKQIGILLLPSFSHMALGAVVEPLFVANWLTGRKLHRWRVLSLDGKPVRTSGDLLVPVDAGIADAVEFDALYVLASFDVKRLTRDRSLKAWLRRVARHGATIAAIETACEVVAAAGLLDGHEVAVHWDNLQGFAESHPGCHAVTALYTVSPGRLTCAGHCAILDMMLHGIAADQGQGLAGEIAAHLMLPSWRKGEVSQPAPWIKAHHAGGPNATEPSLGRALTLMEKTIEEPIPCSTIARKVGVTSRQLQRLFARALDTTPVRHYQRLRLSRAHALLQQTDLSVTEIAISAGFNSLEHFCRLYRRQFNCRPRDDRRQSVAAPVLRRRA